MFKKLIRVRAVRDRTGKSITDIYAEMAQGTFPKNVRIGPRAVAWVEDEIEAWIAERIAVRDAAHTTEAA